MKKFCRQVFPNIETNISKPGWLEGRSILTPTNNEVSTINLMMQQWVPGTVTKLCSADTLENPNDAFRFNTEYLNTLQPNGFPEHMLTLKAGMPLMLLRNVNPRQGLCNGTRLIYEKTIDNKLIQCRIVGSGGPHSKARRLSIRMTKETVSCKNCLRHYHQQVSGAVFEECWSLAQGSGVWPQAALCGLLQG